LSIVTTEISSSRLTLTASLMKGFLAAALVADSAPILVASRRMSKMERRQSPAKRLNRFSR
jgi:hypothetical protein